MTILAKILGATLAGITLLSFIILTPIAWIYCIKGK